MTVILDPGTDANSYIDALSRPWRLTAGLWKAKDTADLAADASALAAAQAHALAALSGSCGVTSWTTLQTLITFNATITGYWAAAGVWADMSGGNSVPTALYFNGSLIVTYNTVAGQGGGVSTPNATFITSGQAIDLRVSNGPGQCANAQLVAWFVPTPSYPH